MLTILGSDYDPLITSITTRIDPVSLEELYGHLLTHEQRLDHANSAADLAVSNVNIAQKNNFPTGRPPRPFSAPSRQHTVPSFSNRGSGCWGRGSLNHYSSPRPTCQVCLKPGHTTAKCYHRFDHAYEVEPAPPSVYYTAPSAPSDVSWYPDTGSTHHLTHDLSNLTIRADEYHGPDQIRVGNGQGLPISHAGLSSLSTPTRVFKLSQLLHVPQIQKNLISVNKFTCDNQVFIEFHPTFFCVKDLYTGTLLLKGPSKDGLYP
jgi:hypothetical protein